MNLQMGQLRNDLPRSYTTYGVSEAENGFIFWEYSIALDELKAVLCRTPEELGKAIMAWQSNRVAAMIKYFNSEKKDGMRLSPRSPEFYK